MNFVKHVLIVIMMAITLPYASGCALEEVVAADEQPAVIYYNGAYGYYYPCEYNYSIQCWYPAPPGYVYGRPIIWGPHYLHPGYRYPSRPYYRGPGPGYHGGWGRGGGRGGRR